MLRGFDFVQVLGGMGCHIKSLTFIKPRELDHWAHRCPLHL